jgi:lysophospholipase L1-like esterase
MRSVVMGIPLVGAGQTVLFQGDSITDAGRSRDNPAELGRGYANLIAAWFGMLHPELQVRFLNRGISGNRAVDLQARWQADCLDLKPDWVSIMIGINDTWRRYDRNDPTSAADYTAAYREILTRTRDQAQARLVLLEPFVLPHPADRRAWREDLDPKIAAVRELAREFGAIYIPLDGLLAAATTRREPAFWAADGVHPTQVGHAFIARAWLQALDAL